MEADRITASRIITERDNGWRLWDDSHVKVLIDEIERLRRELDEARSLRDRT